MQTTGLSRGLFERGSPETKDRFCFAYQKGVDVATRTVECIASTIQIDRDGEIILPSAFEKTLPIFLKTHAPLQTQHAYRTESGSPAQIGWIMDGRIERQLVRVWATFDESDPADPCERWWRRASNPKGKGIALSVGFRPVRWIEGSAKDLTVEFPELKAIFAEAGVRDDDRFRVYTEIELYEISVVGVPSNRGALQVLGAKAADPDADDPGLDEKAVDGLAAKIADAVAAAVNSEIENLQLKIDEVRDLVVSLSPDLVDPEAPDARAPRGKGGEDAGKDAQGAEAIRKAAQSLQRACAT